MTENAEQLKWLVDDTRKNILRMTREKDANPNYYDPIGSKE